MLRAGVNFINVLRAAFMCADPESIRTQPTRQYHFTLLGSGRVNAARKTLMKLTPSPDVKNQMEKWGLGCEDRTGICLSS